MDEKKKQLEVPKFFFHFIFVAVSIGKSALRAAEAAGGPRASALLAKLHSGLMSQFLKIFVPYVQGLTEAVKKQVSIVFQNDCDTPTVVGKNYFRWKNTFIAAITDRVGLAGPQTRQMPKHRLVLSPYQCSKVKALE